MDKETFNDFITLVTDVWEYGVFGIDIGKIMFALLVFFFFLFIRGLFSQFVVNRIKALTKKTKTEIDDMAIEALEHPLRFVPIVIGVFLATELLSLDETLQQGAYNLNRSLITFNIFWAIYKMVGPLSQTFGGLRGIFTESMIVWMIKALRALVFFMGAAAILEIWGIKVAPLIAGLGLFGVAVALGAQDLFKNLIAGLFIIGEKRFHPGDWVKVDGIVEGTVEEIGFRTTTIRQFDKAPVFVPNAKLSDNAVINFTRMTHRRIYWKIGLVYHTTIEQLKEIRQRIDDHVMNSADFAHPPEVPTFVRVDSFNDSSIDLMLYCFTKTTNWGEWLEIKEKLALEIKTVVEDAGSSFAFPSQSVYLESMPDSPENFPLPQKIEAT
ncbi:mechanosensitive ion channel family protein [Paremcibacter congregatus]|uniref:Mechanosensitive ion channel protein MscS n=1 Tax=Paremcibacter congregatus TaxID=2043170 RepID=A0A2G4YTM1_9PROT|nr:mechanosensitive ion channel family protein [Paremcibacter congregatus]PHZ85689.1 mechanosensitive ion channel protein MscS [Paremcibacter congregatus]QDE26649.1 mechanosensitive ion channel family protein [Paremcibacter congregatus]|tara:strand:+ start:4353 stop:5498 length:1146 start_codon:yes stop_codon:yes gene_type:complete